MAATFFVALTLPIIARSSMPIATASSRKRPKSRTRGGRISMEAIGGKVALKKRILQRRLEAEGTSYQQLLQDTRHELARRYLERTILPVPEISFLLAFEEPTSFYRAFWV